MKILVLALTVALSSQAMAAVKIMDKAKGTVVVTGTEASALTEAIQMYPVMVQGDSYVVTFTASYVDFGYNERTGVTGSVTCKKDGSSCVAQGSQIREKGDGWFSPEAHIARVFGLQDLTTAKTKSFIKCQDVYESVACDFKLKD